MLHLLGNQNQYLLVLLLYGVELILYVGCYFSSCMLLDLRDELCGIKSHKTQLYNIMSVMITNNKAVWCMPP